MSADPRLVTGPIVLPAGWQRELRRRQVIAAYRRRYARRTR